MVVEIFAVQGTRPISDSIIKLNIQSATDPTFKQKFINAIEKVKKVTGLWDWNMSNYDSETFQVIKQMELD